MVMDLKVTVIFFFLYVLQGETVSLKPNHQTGGPGYHFWSGSKSLNCLAIEAMLVACLGTSQLSGSFAHTSPTTASKYGYFRWGAKLQKCLITETTQNKHCISEATSGEIAHLKNVQMENSCACVDYIRGTKLL